MAVQNIPAAEVDVTESLVRGLLAEQHPDLADRSLTLVANGWDNAIFRVGDHLVARLPRRQLGADLVINEQRWLPGLAERLPIPIAAPMRIGRPSQGFPWHWSICAWFEGDVVADVTLRDPARDAVRLGEFVAALHTPAPHDAPENPFRGQPVRDLRPRVFANVDQLAEAVDARAVRARFDELADVAEWSAPPVWLHGDLHSANLIAADGALSAVLDFGDITSGDPAVDLAVAWMLFGPDERADFRRAAGGGSLVDDATWSRGQAWALHFALLYVLHSADNERFGRMGARLLASVFERP